MAKKTGDDNDDTITPDPQGVSDEVRDLILRNVNAAVSSQLGRKLTPAIEEGMAPIKTLLEQMGTQKAEPPKPNGKGETSNEVKELRAQVKAMEAANKAEREAREAEQRARLSNEQINALRQVLVEAGVEQLRVRGAAAVLREHVRHDNAGNIIWRVDRGGYHEDLSVADGVKEWMDTDEGKAYLPPTGVAGSGKKPGQRSPGGGAKPTEVTKKQSKREQFEILGAQIRSMMGSAGTVKIE